MEVTDRIHIGRMNPMGVRLKPVRIYIDVDRPHLADVIENLVNMEGVSSVFDPEQFRKPLPVSKQAPLVGEVIPLLPPPGPKKRSPLKIGETVCVVIQRGGGILLNAEIRDALVAMNYARKTYSPAIFHAKELGLIKQAGPGRWRLTAKGKRFQPPAPVAQAAE